MVSERKFVTENIRRVLLKEYIMKETARAGFGGLDIQRTPMGTRVTMVIERPGLVIGRKGESIKKLTEAVEKRFQFDNPQIEVQEVPNPSLNAQIMAEKLASALERGWHFRRAGHSTVRRIMEAGARGCQVTIAGKLTGQRHRTEKFKDGHIKFCGEPSLQWMDRGFATAKVKLGIIGASVWIMNPNAKLPDEVNIGILAPEEAPASEKTAEGGKEGEAGPVTDEKAPETTATEEPAHEETQKEIDAKEPTPTDAEKPENDGGSEQ